MRSIAPVIAFLTLSVVCAAQQTLLVPSQYATIQSAINAAQNGDSVIVSPGTYFEHLDFFGRNIDVSSIAGPSATIIDGGGNGRCVYFGNGETAAATIAGFTITHGRAAYNGIGYSNHGAGIYCWFSSPTISNCIITENSADDAGGGIGAFVASPTITTCRIVANTAGVGIISGGGANIWIQDLSTPTIENCLIAGGSSYNGAGIALYNGPIVTMTNCTIVGNTATQGGGITAQWNSVLFLRNSIVWGNSPANIATAFNAGPGFVAADHCDLESPATTMVQCMAINPSFLGGAQAFLLGPGSPCIDAGAVNFMPLSTTDLEGDPRVVAGTIDIGADEFMGLGSAATGNIGLGAGGPFDVLSINGSAGSPLHRVDVPVNTTITISVAQPPTTAAPAAFVLFGLLGVPGQIDSTVLPLGIGTMCFVPYTLNPTYPGVFQVATTYDPDPNSLVPGSLTPWTYTKASGLHLPFQVTFQGVIVETTPFSIRVTNGVLLNIY